MPSGADLSVGSLIKNRIGGIWLLRADILLGKATLFPNCHQGLAAGHWGRGRNNVGFMLDAFRELLLPLRFHPLRSGSLLWAKCFASLGLR